MKPILTKSIALVFGFILLVNFSVKSQDFGELFKAGPEDANTYLQNYVEPLMFSFNNGLSSGWYNTAKPHKLLGFDLTISANIANIPDEDKLFNFVNSNFNNLELASGSSAQLPTIVGGPTTTQLRLADNATITGTDGGSISYPIGTTPFTAAEGIDTEDFPLTGFPVPTVNLGIGLVKNTDLKIRYIPSIDTEDLSFDFWGVGILHDLKQWIPGLKQVPIDVSGFFGTTSLTAEFTIDENITDSDVNFNAGGTAEFKASATTIQILASKKIAVLTPYVGVGYNIASSSIKVNGNYEFDDVTTAASPDVVIVDPIDLDFSGGSSPRLTAGLRLKLLILTIHADYSLQKYSTLSLGVGLSIR